MEHRLWVQLRSYSSSDKVAFKALDKAWEAAVANLNGVGMRTKEEIRDDAVERAFLWADRITDGVDELTETEVAVMGYVMSETERRGMMRVTYPSRAVGEYAKVSAMTASARWAPSPRRASWSGTPGEDQARSATGVQPSTDWSTPTPSNTVAPTPRCPHRPRPRRTSPRDPLLIHRLRQQQWYIG